MLPKPIASYWQTIQRSLFPGFATELGPTTDKHHMIIVVLDIIEIERFIRWQPGIPVRPGRPEIDRSALARAFIAKAVLNCVTTKALIDRLKVDMVLRRICGFEGKLPCEATFSNGFAEFSRGKLPERVHEAIVRSHYQGRLVGHVSRDATAIEAREKRGPSHTETEKKSQQNKRKAGRPKKGSHPPQPKKRLDRQLKMTASEMLADLPTHCNLGAKQDSHNNRTYWIGYKLHIDCGDGGVPLACILTSASLHDCQVAIPLEAMTIGRVTSLYSVMDAGYDCAQIFQFVKMQDKVPIIDPNKQRNRSVPLCPATRIRYRERTTIERVNSDLKDNFGGNNVRVKGHDKVFAHLMFGMLALTAQRLITVFS